MLKVSDEAAVSPVAIGRREVPGVLPLVADERGHHGRTGRELRPSDLQHLRHARRLVLTAVLIGAEGVGGRV